MRIRADIASRISLMYSRGHTIEEIAFKCSLYEEDVMDYLIVNDKMTSTSSLSLGSKRIPYYNTEAEMQYKPITVAQLSFAEKQILTKGSAEPLYEVI